MSMKNHSALVVLSGGQDSATCLFWAKQYFDEVHAITFNYSQRHDRELMAAARCATLANVASHEVVTIGPILKSTSPLVNSVEELERYATFESMEKIIGDRVEKTFVPMRNALFLTLAANHAVALGMEHLVTGVCQADNANYPDCRQSFIDAQQHTIQEALGKQFYIHTPLMNLSKAASIKMLRDNVGLHGYAALAWTHTAYDGAFPPVVVGGDHASVLRNQGFINAGLPDPLLVRAFMLNKINMYNANGANEELCVEIEHLIDTQSHLLAERGHNVID